MGYLRAHVEIANVPIARLATTLRSEIKWPLYQ